MASSLKEVGEALGGVLTSVGFAALILGIVIAVLAFVPTITQNNDTVTYTSQMASVISGFFGNVTNILVLAILVMVIVPVAKAILGRAAG